MIESAYHSIDASVSTRQGLGNVYKAPHFCFVHLDQRLFHSFFYIHCYLAAIWHNNRKHVLLSLILGNGKLSSFRSTLTMTDEFSLCIDLDIDSLLYDFCPADLSVYYYTLRYTIRSKCGLSEMLLGSSVYY
jgi:hypothetical protein